MDVLARNRLMGAIQPLGGPARLPGGAPVPPTLSGPPVMGMTGNMPLPPQAVGGMPPNPLGNPIGPPIGVPVPPSGGYGGASLPPQMPTPVGGPVTTGVPQPPPNPGRGLYTMVPGQRSQLMNRQRGWGRTGHI